MAEPFDFTGKNIEDTYQRVVQTDGTNFYDGTGSAVSIGGSQNLQQVTDQGSATTTPITASIISASSYEGFGTDLQIASASNISNLYITEFRETGSSFSNTGQPEIGSILVLDISGSGDGNESVLRRMDFQAFNKAFYASASLSTLLELSASIASGAAAGLYSNGVFYQNGLEFDLNQDGGVGTSDLLLLLAAFGNTLEGQPPTGGSPTINKAQLRFINATHEGEGETQFMSGSFLITTASLSGSSKPPITLLKPGTLKVDSHITSSGNISSSGNVTARGFLLGDINVGTHFAPKANPTFTSGITVSGSTSITGSLTVDGDVVIKDNHDLYIGDEERINFRQGSNANFASIGASTLSSKKHLLIGGGTGTNTTILRLYETSEAVFFENSGLSDTLVRDFRVEGKDDPHLLFTTGSTARVGIGTSTPNEKLSVEGNISASGELIGIIDGGTF